MSDIVYTVSLFLFFFFLADRCTAGITPWRDGPASGGRLVRTDGDEDSIENFERREPDIK
jgi:hypothetical protein